MVIKVLGRPSPDIPAWSYAELDELNASYKPRHMAHWKVFQLDRVIEYIEDLGPATGIGFVIPGGVRTSTGHYISLCTVGELMDVADSYRATKAAIDWMTLSADEDARRAAERKGRKVYGRRYSRR